MNARVFALADPRALAGQRSWAARLLMRRLGVRPGAERFFDISASSGWLCYEEPAALWPATPPSLVPRAADAKAIAERTLRELSYDLSVRTDPELEARCGATALLPVSLRPVELALVAHPDDRYPAHWLYRAVPCVSLASGESVPVYGAGVAVRIGHRGRVVSLHSNFRPVTRERITTTVTDFAAAWAAHPFRHEHEGADGHGHSHDELPPHELVYLQEGEGIPQFYIAPFYLARNGHVFSLVSASEWSLAVEFLPEDHAEGTRLTAVVLGGSGDYQFNWALADPTRAGFIELGSGELARGTADSDFSGRVSTVDVAKGAYLFMVNVRDARTGAFRHAQQEYVSRGVTGLPPGTMPEFRFTEDAPEALA